MQIETDLILLDIQLPAWTAMQWHPKLRKRKELENTPIIAVTSYAMVGDRERALGAGATIIWKNRLILLLSCSRFAAPLRK